MYKKKITHVLSNSFFWGFFFHFVRGVLSFVYKGWELWEFYSLSSHHVVITQKMDMQKGWEKKNIDIKEEH
jgi:hypothetical protein